MVAKSLMDGARRKNYNYAICKILSSGVSFRLKSGSTITPSPSMSKPHSENISQRRIVIHARTLMAARGIRSGAAMRRLLNQAGVDISLVQLLRIIDNKCGLLNRDVLEGMLTVLSCSVHELIGDEPLKNGND